MNGLPIERPLERRVGTKKPRDFRAQKVTPETNRSEIKTRKKNREHSSSTECKGSGSTLRVQEIVTASRDHTDTTKADHEAQKQNIHESVKKHGGAKKQHAMDTTRKFNFT